ncbi:MAG: hypothetical protein GY803_04780 [Chloroflexi bacterium]|nr:hypothetical protein [Chloroflexota bacterium]
MVAEKDQIPDEMSIREASAFWDEHSVADYDSHIVEFEYDPDDRITFVPIAANLADSVKKRAQDSGVSVETLINLWVQEKLNYLQAAS